MGLGPNGTINGIKKKKVSGNLCPDSSLAPRLSLTLVDYEHTNILTMFYTSQRVSVLIIVKAE